MLSAYENNLHISIVKCSARCRADQNESIKLLIQVERRRIYKKFGRRNLVEYLIKDLGIDPTYTFELNRVTQKALEFPLLAQRNKPCKVADAIEAMCDSFLKREDPVEKAKRSEMRPTKITIKRRSERNVRTSGRVPFAAAEKHAVYLKSGGRCMYSDHHGRCKERRHLAIHRLKPVSEGGTNDPANLVHICWHHHDWIHRLSFPGMEMPLSFVSDAKV